jgi:class 3 adenylate cyclase
MQRVPYYFFLLLCVCLLNPGKLFARAPLPDSISTLWKKYSKAADDSSRVVYLMRLAYFYGDYLEDNVTADSLGEAAIKMAEMSLRPGLMMYAYNKYVEVTDKETYYNKALSYANKALQNSRITNNLTMRWRACISLTQVYISRFRWSNAIQSSNEAMDNANLLDNDTLITETYLWLGKSQGSKNQKLEAFRNFQNARERAEKIGDSALLRKCNSELFRFYYYNNLFDDAINCKRKEGLSILNAEPVDSVAYMWTIYDLQLADVRQKNGCINEQTVKGVLDFAIRSRNERLKNWEFSLYRKHLLELEEVETLYAFYKKSYPDDFRKLYTTNPEMYYRLKAYFAEFEKKTDSATWYFNRAEVLLLKNTDKNNIYKANFYNRFGQFYIRHGFKREAIEKFTRAYILSKGDNNPLKFEYMLVASRNLETLFLEAGDYQKAWFYSSATLKISDSISKNTENDQIMAETVRQTKFQKAIDAEKNLQKIRQGTNQLYMMAGGVVFFIIVSLLAYRNFRNQKRLNALLDQAKKQSDELLLNILPHETAEELKSRGKASAKRFDEVTVMFTDFKNFTQASERMSAEELVAEINFYYSEFDNIISRHNIEKIKIIGDSYMCAGGLPVANETHAIDVVHAAVELQEFMIAQRTERLSQGKSYFELRIGIHSGPVVAGIVGLKKFAYDIWGDTVNTASRMENCGVPNKINISGETYLLVKHRFGCTYRGKVPAKHKGEIDMYFVDSSII